MCFIWTYEEALRTENEDSCFSLSNSRALWTLTFNRLQLSFEFKRSWSSSPLPLGKLLCMLRPTVIFSLIINDLHM